MCGLIAKEAGYRHLRGFSFGSGFDDGFGGAGGNTSAAIDADGRIDPAGSVLLADGAGRALAFAGSAVHTSIRDLIGHEITSWYGIAGSIPSDSRLRKPKRFQKSHAFEYHHAVFYHFMAKE